MSRSGTKIALLSAIISIISAITYMFLPGTGSNTYLHWNSTLKNVLAPNVNYYPQEILITGNCEELSKLPGGRIFTSVPATEEKNLTNTNARTAVKQALTIDKTTKAAILIRSQGKKLLYVDTNSCRLFQLHLGHNRHTFFTDVSIDNVHSGEQTDDISPMPLFIGFFSHLGHTNRNALTMTVIADNSFQQHASYLKLIAGFITLMSVAITAMFVWMFSPQIPQRIHHRVHTYRRYITYGSLKIKVQTICIDIFVFLALLSWHFIGANTADDGYILDMAKERSLTSYDPNYFRWFGANESPFGWFYGIYTFLDKISHASFWLRLPELFFGIICWLIVRHGIIPLLRAELHLPYPSFLSALSTACAFLLYWFTFNNGIRPEAIIACGFTIVLWLSFLAHHRKNPFIAYIAGICAAYTLTCGPTGIIVLAPIGWLLLHSKTCFNSMLNQLRTQSTARQSLFTSIIMLSSWCAVIPVAFYFISFPSFLFKAHLQTGLGPCLHWFEEKSRYNLLFSYGADGSMPRRVAVLSTFLAIAYLGIYSFISTGGKTTLTRNLTAAQARHAIHLSEKPWPEVTHHSHKHKYNPPGITLNSFIFLCIASFVLLALTPTKPTHHFGAFASIGALTVAIATVIPSYLIFNTLPKRLLWLISVLAITALAYTGPNSYWFVSSANILWSEKPIRYGTSIGTLLIALTGFIAIVTFMKAFFSQYTSRTSYSPSLLSVTTNIMKNSSPLPQEKPLANIAISPNLHVVTSSNLPAPPTDLKNTTTQDTSVEPALLNEEDISPSYDELSLSPLTPAPHQLPPTSATSSASSDNKPSTFKVNPAASRTRASAKESKSIKKPTPTKNSTDHTGVSGIIQEQLPLVPTDYPEEETFHD